jgi:hypothetical protein
VLQDAEWAAWGCDNGSFSCRFLTADADIEHNESMRTLYKKWFSPEQKAL